MKKSILAVLVVIWLGVMSTYPEVGKYVSEVVNSRLYTTICAESPESMRNHLELIKRLAKEGE